MYEERQSRGSISRRRVLSALGTGALASLAGCQTMFGDNEDPAPKSLDEVRLATLPSSYGRADERLAIPSADLIETFNLRHKQQVRIKRDGEQYAGEFLSALYTIRTDASFTDSEENTIWLSEAGLDRINTSDGWLVSLQARAPHDEMDSRSEAEQNSEYVEQSIDARGNDFIACAPNGGGIESNTDKQALRVASELEETAWVCAGYNEGGGAHDRWYVEPELLHPASYPKLGELLGYDGDDDENQYYEYDTEYERSVMFTASDASGIRIGGLVRDEVKFRVRDVLKQHFEDAGVNVIVRVERDGPYAATDTTNIANRLTDDNHHGLQIAQSDEVREEYWVEVADAIIEAFAEEV